MWSVIENLIRSHTCFFSCIESSAALILLMRHHLVKIVHRPVQVFHFSFLENYYYCGVFSSSRYRYKTNLQISCEILKVCIVETFCIFIRSICKPSSLPALPLIVPLSAIFQSHLRRVHTLYAEVCVLPITTTIQFSINVSFISSSYFFCNFTLLIFQNKQFIPANVMFSFLSSYIYLYLQFFKLCSCHIYERDQCFFFNLCFRCFYLVPCTDWYGVL